MKTPPHSRQLLCAFAAGLLLAVLLSALYCRHPSVRTTTTLYTNQFPLEIFGPPGEVSKIWTIWSAKAGRFKLRANNITSDRKVSVRLGDGPWYQIANSNAVITGNAGIYGGIGGAWQGLMEMELLAPRACAGENLLQFRLDEAENVSSTARIIEASVINDDPQPCEPLLLSPQQRWVEAGPDAAWDLEPAALARGSNLYYTAQLKNHWTGSNLPPTVTCAACHWSDGGDLTYFGFSSNSIVERSRFHGRTEVEGKEIANWVFGTSMHPRRGRPWHPTFQPGPGLSQRPGKDWMAGMGMEWVLPHDSNTWAYIPLWANFTNLPPQQDLPVATTFPDPNAWFAVMHPHEFWGTNDANIEALLEYAKTFLATTTRSNFRDKGNSFWNKMSAVDSGSLHGLTETPDKRAQMAVLAVRQLYVWKFMEVIQRLDLWDSGELILDHTTARSIPHIRVGIFGDVFHFRVKWGDRQHKPPSFFYRNGTWTEWSLGSHQWYMLALSINGTIPRNGFSPLDYPYLEAFAEAQMNQDQRKGTTSSSPRMAVASTAQVFLALMYYGASGVRTPHTSGDAFALYLDGRGPYLTHTPNYIMDTWKTAPGVPYWPADRNARVEQFARAWLTAHEPFDQRYYITNDLREINGNETGDPEYASAATQRHKEMLVAFQEFKISLEIIDRYLLLGEKLWPGVKWRPESDLP